MYKGIPDEDAIIGLNAFASGRSALIVYFDSNSFSNPLRVPHVSFDSSLAHRGFGLVIISDLGPEIRGCKALRNQGSKALMPSEKLDIIASS
jgi:hypothetical protein